MEELDWTFDKEEFDEPLKVGDIINYNGTLECYISTEYVIPEAFPDLQLFRDSFLQIAHVHTPVLENKYVTEVKMYNEQWIFKLQNYKGWHVYNEKCIEIVPDKGFSPVKR